MKEYKLSQCCQRFWELADYLMEQVMEFDIFDWGMLKGCLVSMGVLIGCSFASFFRRLKPLVWLFFLVTWGYTMWRMFAPLYEEFHGE